MSYDSFEYESPISVKPDRNIRTRKHFSFCGCLLGVAVGGVVAGGAVAVVMWYMFGNYNCQTNGTFFQIHFQSQLFSIPNTMSHLHSCL